MLLNFFLSFVPFDVMIFFDGEEAMVCKVFRFPDLLFTLFPDSIPLLLAAENANELERHAFTALRDIERARFFEVRVTRVAGFYPCPSWLSNLAVWR